MKLFDLFRRPVRGKSSNTVKRTAGSRKGTLSNWTVQKLSRFSESAERTTIGDRAQDIVANDPHAASVIDSMAVNIVGTGINPQSNPATKMLGWTDDQANDFREQCENAWAVWCRQADASGRLPFWAIQHLSIQSLLVRGEFVRIPVMLDEPGRDFSLAMQCVDPARLSTPSDKMSDKAIREGIRFGARGNPAAYMIANPATGTEYWNHLTSKNYATIPAHVGHRPGLFHVFVQKEEEQIRGVSILAPAMKFFRDLSDYLDFELVGSIVAASFPVWIETTDAFGDADNKLATGQDTTSTRYEEIEPGRVFYGDANQKPHVLDAKRPSNTFEAFVERILRAVGASVGMPYEVISKDFSKTNYSSARAALLEAWRVFNFYQKWLVDCFCQPVWEMVLEEAWLRDMITLPPGSPDWYAARFALTRAQWIPPKKGHVDPVKEIKAAIEAKEHNIQTLASITAEFGGDWESNLNQRAREKALEKEKGIEPVAAQAAPAPDPEKKEEDD